MFRNIHKKYIAVNVTVLTAIIVALLVAVNVSMQSMRQEGTRSLLSLILRSGGDPAVASAQSTAAGADRLIPGTESGVYLDMKTASYFLVRTSGGTVSSVDVRYAYSVNEEEARSLTVLAMDNGSDSGRLGRFEYLRQVGPTGALYAFLDASEELLAEARLLTVSVAAGVIAEALILVFVGFMAARRVRPVEQLLAASQDIMEKSAAGMEAGAACLISTYKDRGSANASPALQEGTVLAGIAADLRGVAEAIDRPGRPQDVNVPELLRRIVTENETWLAEQGLSVQSAVEGDAVLKARPQELKALFEILIENAGDNAAAGSTVFLDLVTDERNLGVLVHFDVDDLPQTEPDSLIQDRAGRDAHFGGGLYAASLLAELNHGRLGVEYLDPPGICFTVRFRRPRR